MHHEIRMTAAKIARRLSLIEGLVYRQKAPLGQIRLKKLANPEFIPTDFAEDTSDWEVIKPNTFWGDAKLNFILRSEFAVPENFDKNAPIGLYLPIGEAQNFSHPEALVYIDDKAYAATDRHHQEFILRPEDCDGETHQLLLHGWMGDPKYPKVLLSEPAVVQIDMPTREFIAWARTALMAANFLEAINPAKSRLYNALDNAFKCLDILEPFGEHFYDSVPGALDVLRAEIESAGVASDLELVAIGHAHIDVAWLWTLGQTRRKAGRTFHTVLRQMEQFPDYHFTQSQAQLYDYVEKDYPELFEGIKARVAEGRWETIGGMWVEADCNLTGGESLARQFLLGRSYFRKHFGKEAESPVLWLPDVFGYAWNLPQLIKLAGMEYFFTIKIGWNQVNKMPYDSFWWQGLDGTKVLTHFSTSPESEWGETNLMNSATYNANLTAFTVLGSWAKLKHKESQRTMLMSYGYGDGGGGPTREMNENAQVLKNFPALPQVKQGKVIDFFRQLERESAHALPTWNSELYLEIHRGTYTSQSRNKRANRKSEFLLHDSEFLASYAHSLNPAYDYPYTELQKAWELVCLNQFHDIIPGSSINEVYKESAVQYAEIQQLAEKARDSALAALEAEAGGDLLLINPTSFERQDLVFWQGSLPEKARFEGEIYVQAIEGGTLLAAGKLQPYSIESLRLVEGELPRPSDRAYAEEGLLENGYLRVEFNQAGDIVRIYDKIAEREVLAEGAIGNQWQAFEDRPNNWDAWDIDIFYDDKQFLAFPASSMRVVENGDLRASIEIRRRILNSDYVQRVSLSYNSPRLDFDSWIDWRERHILLKVAFPVAILAPVANFEVQWGYVQRPTHRNTSWDWARFETCAQKWVDLSESNYGVALLNDCKYGHDIRDNVIRLSLLRSSTSPDPEADQGEHRFSYSLLPHAANLHTVAREAYCLNDPVISHRGSSESGKVLGGFIKLKGGAIIETIKAAEDGNGIIVRLYENQRRRGWIELETAFAIQEAYVTNLLEENQEALQIEGKRLKIYLKPFQILNLRLCFI